MWGPFKASRSAFGEWLDKRGISQTELSQLSGVPRTTINSLARGEAKRPSRLTARKIVNALRDLDEDVDVRDFWDV